MMRKPSTGLSAAEIALRTAFSALSVRLIMLALHCQDPSSNELARSHAMRQFIDKTAFWWLSGCRLCDACQVSDRALTSRPPDPQLRLDMIEGQFAAQRHIAQTGRQFAWRIRPAPTRR